MSNNGEANHGASWLDEVIRSSPHYVDALYQEYRRDPGALDESWALVFAGHDLARLTAPRFSDRARASLGRETPEASGLVHDIVHCYRELGHFVAELDPLGQRPREHPLLALAELGVSERDLDRVVTWSPFAVPSTAPCGT